MRQVIRSVSSNPEWNDKKFPLLLGLNYFKQYAITKNIYFDQTITSQSIKKEKDVKIYYFDGFLKNSSQFSHVKRIAQQYQTNLYYVDTLNILLYDFFSDDYKTKKNDLLQSINTTNSIFICSFDSIQILNKHFFPHSNLSNVDLIAISPYFQNYSAINKVMKNQFLYNLQKNIVQIYAKVDNSYENDYTVQKYMNSKDFLDVVNEMKLEVKKSDEVDSNKSHAFQSLNILFSTQEDDILFEKKTQDSRKQETFNYNLEKTYSLFNTKGHKTQYLINYYSPVMSLLYNDPSSIILEQILKDKFSNK